VTHLRQIMLEELERRNYAPGTITSYIRTVEHFARHFHRAPDQFLRGFLLHLLRHAHPRCVSSSLCHQQNQLKQHPQLLQDHLFLHSPRSRPTHTVHNTSPAIRTTPRNPIENT
jgi:hypothetical protein